LDSTLAPPTVIAGVGGALCLVWGLRAVAGSPRKALPLLTLVVLNFVLLSQAVTGWTTGSEQISGRRTAVIVITLLFGLSLLMLVRIAHAGQKFDGPQSAQKRGTGNKS